MPDTTWNADHYCGINSPAVSGFDGGVCTEGAGASVRSHARPDLDLSRSPHRSVGRASPQSTSWRRTARASTRHCTRRYATLGWQRHGLSLACLFIHLTYRPALRDSTVTIRMAPATNEGASSTLGRTGVCAADADAHADAHAEIIAWAGALRAASPPHRCTAKTRGPPDPKLEPKTVEDRLSTARLSLRCCARVASC